MKWFAVLLLTGCTGFSGPLMRPKVAWNPQRPDPDSYPCPYYFPYFEGWNEDGTPDCTVRPMDIGNEDVDPLPMP